MNRDQKLKKLIILIDSIQKGNKENLKDALEISEIFIKLSQETYNKIAYKYTNLHNEISVLEKRLWEKLKYYHDILKSDYTTTNRYRYKLLEIGAGSGKDMLYALHKFDFEVYGIDNSETFISILEEKINSGSLPKDCIYKADMRNLSMFNDNEFDIVRHNGTLLHLPIICKNYMADKAVSESKRVLKTNGLLFFMVKEGKSIAFVDTNEGLGKRFYQFYTEDSLKEMLIRNELNILEMKKETGDFNTSWLYAFCTKS